MMEDNNILMDCSALDFTSELDYTLPMNNGNIIEEESKTDGPSFRSTYKDDAPPLKSTYKNDAPSFK
jgi:hypothetical protein